MITSTPESVGIPSHAIVNFLHRLRDRRLNMHSVLIIRHGKLVAEGYAPPFNAERKHRMYSVSKSFTALAVGLMEGEGRLSLDDRVACFFPEYCTEPLHPFIAEATIRDMLTMRDCHHGTTHSFEKLSEWLRSWFTTPPSHPAGTVFSYNTTCTNLLCAIVERLSGGTMMEYLYPCLLDPIGFTPGCVCIRTPDGYSFGGSGVLCTPRDLARVALVCLNGGRWEGRQLIGEEYIRQATSRQTDNSLTNSNIELSQGYGYQIWRMRHNGFAFHGMGSQLAFCLPDCDLIVITTGDTQDTSPDISVIASDLWEAVLPGLSYSPLPEDKAAQDELKAALSLRPVLADGAPSSPVSRLVSGKTYRMDPNQAGWSDTRFTFAGNEGRVTFTNRRGVKEIPFGFGYQRYFTFPETHYPGLKLGEPKGTGYEANASAGWVDERTLNVLCYSTDDYLGSLRINAVFDDDRVTILLVKTAEGFFNDYMGYIYGYLM